MTFLVSLFSSIPKLFFLSLDSTMQFRKVLKFYFFSFLFTFRNVEASMIIDHQFHLSRIRKWSNEEGLTGNSASLDFTSQHNKNSVQIFIQFLIFLRHSSIFEKEKKKMLKKDTSLCSSQPFC